MPNESVSFTMNITDQAEKKMTRSITDINPAATDDQIVQLAEGLNSLTTNTLGNISRVEKKDIDPTIEYQDIVWDLTVDGSGVASDTSTNTVTVTISQLPTLSTDLSEWATFGITPKIVVGRDIYLPALQIINTLKITYKLDSWTKDPSAENDDVLMPLFPDFTAPTGTASAYLMFIANTGFIYPCTVYITLPAGSFINGNTTYYYNESVITVNFV